MSAEIVNYFICKDKLSLKPQSVYYLVGVFFGVHVFQGAKGHLLEGALKHSPIIVQI